MSGGSFDYLYMEIEDTIPAILYGAARMLQVMAVGMINNDKLEAAAAVRALAERLIAAAAVDDDLVAVIKAFEWWYSHDIGEDGFDAAWASYQTKQASNKA